MNGFPDTSSGPAPILVLGIGNMLLGDDGVGPALLEQLVDAAARWSGRVGFLDGGTQSLALLVQFSGRQVVIIVDALETGAPPGTVHRMTLNELRELSLGRARSAHEGNARELLAAAELLGELPDRLLVVDVEPESITTGFGLSNHVQEALSAASDQVSCLLSEL